MKINGTDHEVEIIKTNIGLFDTAFAFDDSENETIESIIEWLSFNCTENFIVNATKSSIVAGGWADNKQAYKNGHFKIPSHVIKRGHITITYEVRLKKVDVLAFRLRWIDETSST